MKHLVAFLLAGLLMCAPAYAVTATGNGAFGLPIDLTSQVTNNLPCGNGGTGKSGWTVGALVYASGACTISGLLDVASGSVLCSMGLATAWAACNNPAISGANFQSGTIPSAALVAPPVYGTVNRVAFNGSALTQNTYVAVASPSLVLGTSTGPTGAWDVTVTFQAEQSANNLQMSTCIIGTNAGSSGAGSYDQKQSSICNTSPTNQLAGGTGEINVNGPNTLYTVYSAQYANGATVSFTCNVYSTAVTPGTAGGFCIEKATPI